MSATMQPAPPVSPVSALSALATDPPWLPADDSTTRLTEDEEKAKPEPELKAKLRRWSKMVNIADDPDISADELAKLAMQVTRDYDIDENSRSDWKEKYKQWIKFAMQITEEKTYPWPQASNVIYPLLTSAAIQFAARAYPAIIRDRNVVKGSVIGRDDGVPELGPDGQPVMGPDGQPQWKVQPGAKQARADRIGEHMSWQLLDEQEEWEPQTDEMLVILAIVGSMFRKSYFDSALERNVSETCNALDVVVDYHAKSFETAPRVTQIVRLYPWEIEENIRSGMFLDEDYGADMDRAGDQDIDAETTFLEQHRRWDLDGDGYAEPYIVTVGRDSNKLARIVAAYEMDDIKWTPKGGQVMKITPITYFTHYKFHPSPDKGVYAIGFGHLLFPINSAINSSLNQMFDAGHLQNAGGGFIGSQLSMNTGAVRFQVGEYRQVNTNGATIRDNVYAIPFPGPSPVLMQLLQFLVEAGKEVAAIKDIMVGDMPGDNTSGVTTLAVIEQGLQVFSAIYKRIHRSLKQEFVKLYRLNKRYLPLSSEYQKGDVWKEITQADYDAGAGVEPVSDPRMMTDMQRLGRAQFLGSFKEDPWLDQRKIRVKMLEAAQIPDADTLVLPKLPPNQQAAAAVAQLQLAHEELSIRAAHQEAELAIKRSTEKARQLDLLSHVIVNLSTAAKNDHAAAQGWYQAELDRLRLQIDGMNAGADLEHPTADSPAAAAGIGGGGSGPGGALGASGGDQPAAVPAMAPPSADGGVPAVPG